MRIATEQLVITRGESFELRGLSLTFEPGEHVVLLGRSGSGKSTLLKALAGLLRPSSGRVLWDGEDPWALSAEERRARQAAFGMVFQTDALFDSDTVLQNVELPLIKRGVPRADAAVRAKTALASVRLANAAEQFPEHLSGGMKKRAGIARAIVARPQVLLADDPLAGLDPHTARTVAEVLREAARDRTLIVAMPDPADALPLGRTLRLEDGRLAG